MRAKCLTDAPEGLGHDEIPFLKCVVHFRKKFFPSGKEDATMIRTGLTLAAALFATAPAWATTVHSFGALSPNQVYTWSGVIPPGVIDEGLEFSANGALQISVVALNLDLLLNSSKTQFQVLDWTSGLANFLTGQSFTPFSGGDLVTTQVYGLTEIHLDGYASGSAGAGIFAAWTLTPSTGGTGGGISSVPEPQSWALVGAGILALLFVMRRNKNA